MCWKPTRVVAVFVLLPLVLAGRVGAGEPPAAGGSTAAASPVLLPFGARLPDKADSDVGLAVSTGLRWLAAHQAESGLWEASNLSWCDGKKGQEDLEGAGKPQYGVGVTGMAVSAFLAAGHTHASATEHSLVVAKALQALVKLQDAEGCIGPRLTQHFLYNHAFATLALVEDYGETGEPRLLAPVRKALAFSENARNPGSAWRYGVRPNDDDTSVTGCMAMPIYAAYLVDQAAEAAGLAPPFPVDEATFEGVRAWIDRMTDPDYGRTGYIQKGGSPARPAELIDKFPGELSESCTGIGVFLRAVLPGGDPARDAVLLRKGTGVLRDCLPRWTPGAGNIDFYYWYYGSLAMEAIGGDAADTWRSAVQKALLKGQRKDTDPCAYAGSWDPAGPWGPDGGRIYSTALAVLCLRAAHRFPRLSPDRADLVQALGTGMLSQAETARVFRALAAYRVPSAGRAALVGTSSQDLRVRAAAAAALARCEPSDEGVKRLGALLKDDAVEVRREAAAGLASLDKRVARVADELRAAVDDADTQVRREAILALRALPDGGAEAEPRLREALTDAEPRVRVAAADVLRRLHPEDAPAETLLLGALDTKDEEVRAAAAAALAEAKSPTDAVKQALERCLSDESTRVKVAAARGLVGTGVKAAALVAIVTPCLGSPDLETRRFALELAERLGPEAASTSEAVTGAALSGPTAVRVAAVRALAAMGARAQGTVAVLYLLRGRAPRPVREAAADAVEQAKGDGEALLRALIAALKSSTDNLQAGAILGLEDQGNAAVEPLRALLAPGEVRVQIAALRALRTLGPTASEAVEDAESLLEAPNPPEVVAQAALFLGSVGRRARSSIEKLAVLARGADLPVRMAAIRALGLLGDEDRDAVEALADLATNRKKEEQPARVAALHALTLLGEKSEPALPALRLALSSSDGVVRAAAVDALAAMGKAAIPCLMTAMQNRDRGYADAAMDALGKMGPDAKKAVPKLAELLPGAARENDWAPARALAGIGRPAVHALIALLKEDDSSTRVHAAWALGQIGPDAKAAVSLLKRMAKEDREWLRQAAEDALARIRGD